MKNTGSSMISKRVATSSLGHPSPWVLVVLSCSLACLAPGNAEAQAPSGLSYSPDSVWYSDVLFPKWQPTVNGAVSDWTVSPALPNGLNFNDSTGVITGAPSVQFGWTRYTVTATNASGSASTDIYIRSSSPSSIGPFAQGSDGVWREFSFEISPGDARRTRSMILKISGLDGRVHKRIVAHPDADGTRSVSWGPDGTAGLSPGYYFVEIDLTRDVGDVEVFRKIFRKD